jgi:hypothetical protein
MPNATCFLVAYALLLLLELIRGRISSITLEKSLSRTMLAGASLSLLTHSLYLLDRLFLALANEESPLYLSWHDWAILSSWFLAVTYVVMLFRRPANRVGVFVIPLLISLIGVALVLPVDIGIRNNSASGWRLAHGVAMMVGTMLTALGFAMALMYFLQANRLKKGRPKWLKLQLPSLEYLESFGRICLLGSAGSIGFGMVSGVIMNLVQDGRVEWLDRGILFSGGLFLWLLFASIVQWQFSRRGRGQSTAAMNVVSFVVVAAALGLVLSTPHGSNKPLKSSEATVEPGEKGSR